MHYLPYFTSLLLAIGVTIMARFGLKSMRGGINNHVEQSAEKYAGWSTEMLLGWREARVRSMALAIPIGILLTALLVGLLSRSIVFALAAAAGGWALPGIVHYLARTRRADQIEDQFPDAINVMVASMRAGRSIGQAIREVADKAPAPIAREFAVLTKEIEIGGVSIEQALVRARGRIGDESFSMATTALIISLSRGGDLLIVLERIADSTRELLRLRQKIRSETSAVRAQEKVILSMTPIFGALVCLFDPEIPHILFHTLPGHLILVVVGALQAISVLWIRRILRTAI